MGGTPPRWMNGMRGVDTESHRRGNRILLPPPLPPRSHRIFRHLLLNHSRHGTAITSIVRGATVSEREKPKRKEKRPVHYLLLIPSHRAPHPWRVHQRMYTTPSMVLAASEGEGRRSVPTSMKATPQNGPLCPMRKEALCWPHQRESETSPTPSSISAARLVGCRFFCAITFTGVVSG